MYKEKKSLFPPPIMKKRVLSTAVMAPPELARRRVQEKENFLLPRGLRRGSTAVRSLGLWVRIPLGRHGCLCVLSVVCCQLGGLCVALITRPEESYRLWCVVVCDLDTSRMRRPCPTGGCCAVIKNIFPCPHCLYHISYNLMCG